MRFFQRFPTLEYQTRESRGEETHLMTRTVPNMTVSLQLLVADEEGVSFDFYRIKDRDRPDTVAALFYGSSEYAWIILLANRMRDWYDWPLSDEEFHAYLTKKYETAPGAKDGWEEAHQHIVSRWWLLPDGQQIVLDEAGYLEKIGNGADILSNKNDFVPSRGREAVAVETAYQREYEANETKRLIRVPVMASLPSIDAQLTERLKA